MSPHLQVNWCQSVEGCFTPCIFACIGCLLEGAQLWAANPNHPHTLTGCQRCVVNRMTAGWKLYSACWIFLFMHGPCKFFLKIFFSDRCFGLSLVPEQSHLSITQSVSHSYPSQGLMSPTSPIVSHLMSLPYLLQCLSRLTNSVSFTAFPASPTASHHLTNSVFSPVPPTVTQPSH